MQNTRLQPPRIHVHLHLRASRAKAANIHCARFASRPNGVGQSHPRHRCRPEGEMRKRGRVRREPALVKRRIHGEHQEAVQGRADVESEGLVCRSGWRAIDDQGCSRQV